MSLEKITAREIVQEAGMSGRPEFYSGRGAILSDLDSKTLEKIHELLVREHGKDAGQNFVEMVANIKVLSASDFLTCLYGLEAREWKYNGAQSDLAAGIAVAKDRDGNYDAYSGMMGMAAALSSSGRDDTEWIRGSFLKKHGREGKRIRREVGNGRYLEIGGFEYE